VCCVLCAVCCVLCAVCCVMCVVCVVCCVLCSVCCVLCCALCGVCCVVCAVTLSTGGFWGAALRTAHHKNPLTSPVGLVKSGVAAILAPRCFGLFSKKGRNGRKHKEGVSPRVLWGRADGGEGRGRSGARGGASLLAECCTYLTPAGFSLQQCPVLFLPRSTATGVCWHSCSPPQVSRASGPRGVQGHLWGVATWCVHLWGHTHTHTNTPHRPAPSAHPVDPGRRPSSPRLCVFPPQEPPQKNHGADLSTAPTAVSATLTATAPRPAPSCMAWAGSRGTARRWLAARPRVSGENGPKPRMWGGPPERT
jgi:hypothetical protein